MDEKERQELEGLRELKEYYEAKFQQIEKDVEEAQIYMRKTIGCLLRVTRELHEIDIGLPDDLD